MRGLYMKRVEGIDWQLERETSCKWVYQNAILPNSEMEQEAEVMHLKTADVRGKHSRTLPESDVWEVLISL